MTIRSLERPLECPVGQYRIEKLTMEVTENNKSYLFRFSGLGLKEFPITIKPDEETTFDLVGDVSLSVGHTKMRDGNRGEPHVHSDVEVIDRHIFDGVPDRSHRAYA